MKQWILKFLYNRYKSEFDDMSLVDSLSLIPNDAKPSTVDFLKRAGQGFEKTLVHMMYATFKAKADNPNKGDFYNGVMYNLRFFHRWVTMPKEPEVKKVIPQVKKETDPLEGVRSWSDGMKQIIK